MRRYEGMKYKNEISQENGRLRKSIFGGKHDCQSDRDAIENESQVFGAAPVSFSPFRSTVSFSVARSAKVKNSLREDARDSTINFQEMFYHDFVMPNGYNVASAILMRT